MMKKKRRMEKVLGKSGDNLDVAVIPVKGTLASRVASRAVSRSQSRPGSGRIPPSFGRKSVSGDDMD